MLQKAVDISCLSLDALRGVRPKGRFTSFTFSLNCTDWNLPNLPVELTTQPLNPKENCSGLYTSRGSQRLIQVKLFGKKKNHLYHRGGIVGTIIHEMSHYISDLSCWLEDPGEWYWDSHHPTQNLLYQKYARFWGDSYAGSCPKEATAELFRIIHGHICSEDRGWATLDIVADYLLWFRQDPLYQQSLPRDKDDLDILDMVGERLRG
jgi:hypothetical protein